VGAPHLESVAARLRVDAHVTVGHFQRGHLAQTLSGARDADLRVAGRLPVIQDCVLRVIDCRFIGAVRVRDLRVCEAIESKAKLNRLQSLRGDVGRRRGVFEAIVDSDLRARFLDDTIYLVVGEASQRVAAFGLQLRSLGRRKLNIVRQVDEEVAVLQNLSVRSKREFVLHGRNSHCRDQWHHRVGRDRSRLEVPRRDLPDPRVQIGACLVERDESALADSGQRRWVDDRIHGEGHENTACDIARQEVFDGELPRTGRRRAAIARGVTAKVAFCLVDDCEVGGEGNPDPEVWFHDV